MGGGNMNWKTLTIRVLKVILCAFVAVQIFQFKVKAVQDVTVDVTSLTVAGGIGHDCNRYLEDKHDNSNHWQRCTICGRTYNIKAHTYRNYWTIGDAQNCDPYNHHMFTCTDSRCGYQYQNDAGRAQHQPQGDVWTQHWQYACRTCAKCGKAVTYHDCTIGGQKPGCQVWGRCDGCGTNWGRQKEFQVRYDTLGEHTSTKDGSVRRVCYYCGRYLLTETITAYQEQGQPAQAIYMAQLDLDQAVTVQSVGFNREFSHFADYADANIVDWWTSGNTLYIRLRIKARNYYESSLSGYIYADGRHQNGNYFQYAVYVSNGSVLQSCDVQAPVISSITQRDIATQNGWATQKEITVSGTENYSNTIKLGLYEKDTNNLIYECATQKNQSGAWSAQFQPNIEADAQGREYYVIATDAMGNQQGATEFKVYKVDRVAPKISQADATATNWSKTKTFKAYGTDKGVNNVSIQFSDINPIGYSQPWVNAQISGYGYSQNFILTGDVYGTAVGNVIYKDQLLNGLNKQVKVSNLDNTKPTIVRIDQTSETGYKARVYQNDENSKFGQGSGVAGIYISRYNSKPSENSSDWISWTGGNQSVGQKGTDQSQVVELKSGGGTYYIWLKDLCGNISDVGVYVAPYILRVNPNGGKYIGTRDITSYEVRQFEEEIIEDATDKLGYNFCGWKIA